MTKEAWPTPAGGPSREPLPRVEDLPVAEQGYEQESVKAAFDSFYRHAAQLDAALRTLEAVDSFHRQAAALRADLRALRSAGWTQQSWGAAPTYGYGYGTRTAGEGVSPAVWRIAGEVALLIAVAVGLGVAKLPWWLIVSVMAAAFLLVVLIEWLSARDYVAVAREPVTPPHPVVEAEPATSDEQEAAGWTAFEEAQEPSDAMTMIGAPPAEEPEPVVEEAVAEEVEAVPEAEAETEPEESEESEEPEEPEFEPEPAAVEAPRRRWWRRRHAQAEAQSDASGEIDLPRHVRVLQTGVHAAADPWEEGFDREVLDEPSAAEATEPDDDTDESLSAAAADGEQSGRRRFRRR